MEIKVKMFIARMLQYILIFVPIKKNRIMFYSHERKGYVDNPAYIMNHLLKTVPGYYELFWITGSPETCEKIPDVRIVGRRSFFYFFYFIRTHFFITNDMVDENLIKKRGQVFISTWHGGGAYKKIGLSTCSEDPEFSRLYQKYYMRLDYFITSCHAAKKLFQDAMGLKNTVFLEYGSPRNDFLFGDHYQVENVVRNFYHISVNTKILLFAPSFFVKNQFVEENCKIEKFGKVLQELQNNTGYDWVCIVRHHYFCQNKESSLSHLKILDGNQYFEMQDLLCVADLLVTDFSSSMWDMGLQKKPVMLIKPYIDNYESNNRGFFIAPDQWPYLIIHDILDIPMTYLNYDHSSYIEALQQHYIEMGSYETGKACSKIKELLEILLY